MAENLLMGGIKPSHFMQLLSLLNESTEDCIFLWDIPSDGFYVSPRILQKLELPGSMISNITPLWEEKIHPFDVARFQESIGRIANGGTDVHNLEYRVRTKSGEYEWISCRGKVLRDDDGAPTYLMGVITGINDRYIDPLTGLFRAMRMEPDYLSRPMENGFLLIFGVDNFKDVNEKYGWYWGNRLLKHAAYAISSVLPDTATAYRLDGDKFGILLPGEHKDAAEEVYQKAEDVFFTGLDVRGRVVLCTMSCGCVEYPADSENYDELYQFAESALYEAKRNGKKRLVRFQKESYNNHIHQISMRESLLSSVGYGCRGFSLTYQPQVNGKDGSLKGAEALLRWTSPVYGARSPVEFIPLLEESGLIVPVGRWVIENALDVCARWRDHTPDFCMSINLSYIQLEQDDVPAFLLKALDERGLPPSAVALEITESGQLRDYNYFNGLFSGLAQKDVEIAIDDFGTGYSSLAYLKHLNVDVVKVDKCFVDRILSSEYDFRFLRNLIELAHSVALEVCLEGVETGEEVQALLPLSPDIFQGYYFGHPCPAEIFEERYLGKKFAQVTQMAQDTGQRSNYTEDAMIQEIHRLRAENRRLSKTLRLAHLME